MSHLPEHLEIEGKYAVSFDCSHIELKLPDGLRLVPHCPALLAKLYTDRNPTEMVADGDSFLLLLDFNESKQKKALDFWKEKKR